MGSYNRAEDSEVDGLKMSLSRLDTTVIPGDSISGVLKHLTVLYS